MLKKVRIQIITDRYEVKGSLFETPTGKLLPDPTAPQEPLQQEDVEHMEMTMEARYHDDGTRVCIRYKESELSGMEGSQTAVSFQKSCPGLISMLRDGTVKTALMFEPNKRHLCIYQTQIMPFEVCVHTRTVTTALKPTEPFLWITPSNCGAHKQSAQNSKCACCPTLKDRNKNNLSSHPQIRCKSRLILFFVQRIRLLFYVFKIMSLISSGVLTITSTERKPQSTKIPSTCAFFAISTSTSESPI